MKSLNVKILGKEYQIACPSGSEVELKNAANYLDQKMAEIRNNGRIISFEGILVTVAINLSHELLQQNVKQSTEAASLVANLTSLENKLNMVLQNNSLATHTSNSLEFEYNE
ncbi:MAG: cell division protein ZapA [Gammaproteobacteria bacterium]|jgi:cell division protein ZapA